MLLFFCRYALGSIRRTTILFNVLLLENYTLPGIRVPRWQSSCRCCQFTACFVVPGCGLAHQILSLSHCTPCCSCSRTPREAFTGARECLFAPVFFRDRFCYSFPAQLLQRCYRIYASWRAHVLQRHHLRASGKSANFTALKATSCGTITQDLPLKLSSSTALLPAMCA